MNRIIGLICGWGCEDFIRMALNQASEYCDEVLVNISPHSKALEKFRDSSYDIALEYSESNRKVKLIEYENPSIHCDVKAGILNLMLQNSKFFSPGNWIFILDVDEFYPHESIDNIFYIMKNDACIDQITVEEYYFYINAKHYLNGEHIRLFKIKDSSNRFMPTQKWVYSSMPVTASRDFSPMFHYGMLTNPWQKIEFWKTEYHNVQTRKIEWINYIYKNYDLENEEYWIEENRRMFGIRSPWFSDSFKPDKEGKLFKYNGKHPRWVNENLLGIEDFRDYYGFNSNT